MLFMCMLQAVVLFVDLCHLQTDGQPNLETRRAQLREALDLLKSVVFYFNQHDMYLMMV
jgi:hypothetical protein